MAESNIELGHKSIGKAIDKVKDGEWRIPKFQRDYVWPKKKVIELLDSIYKDMPIGAFFLWNPPKEYRHHFKEMPELNISGETTGDIILILDGQQRLTSLYAVAYGVKVKNNDYSKICFNFEQKKFNDKPRTPINPSIEDIKALNSKFVDENHHSDLMECHTKIFSYLIPTVSVINRSLEVACDVFQRINQGGKKLSIFDLFNALTWKPDFELRAEIENLRKDTSFPESFKDIDNEIFSETISLILKGSSTRSSQLDVEPDKVKEIWPEAKKSVIKSVGFLRDNLGVKTYEMLPYREILPMVAYLHYKTNYTLSSKQTLKLKEWFWKIPLSNRYSFSPFTKMTEDRIKIFDPLSKDKDVEINYIISVNEEILKGIKMSRNTALRNLVLCLLASNRPKDFDNNTFVTFEKDFISQFNKQNLHHIFPKAFLKKHDLESKSNLLLNFCYISERLNKQISDKDPKKYFTEFKEINSEELKESLSSHLIPNESESGIWVNDYQEFINTRANTIWKKLGNLAGDLDAQIDDEFESNLNQVIKKVEKAVRELIHNKLFEEFGETYWKSQINEHIKKDAVDIIEKDIKKDSDLIYEEEIRPPNVLNYINVSHYKEIIIQKNHWGLFADVFPSKQEFERNMDDFAAIRNEDAHSKPKSDQIWDKGRGAVKYFMGCFRKSQMIEDDLKDTSHRLETVEIDSLYEELKEKILNLDSEIQERKKKHYIGFNKKNNFFNLCSVKFRKDCIKVKIFVKKGKLIDPKNITSDDEREDKEIRRIRFDITSKDEIDYAIDLIKQAYHYNEEYIEDKGELTEKDYRRHKFWTKFLDKAKEKNTNFKNLSPSYYHWIGKGGGKSGISLNFAILNNHATVEVYLDIGKREVNKERFDSLFNSKDVIEKIFGDKLNWERLDSKRASRISFKFDESGLKNKENWNDLQNKMINKMILLEKSFGKFIKDLKS